MEVEVIGCDCGDWEVLKVNGDILYEGHSIPQFIWIDLLNNKCGATAYTTTITDEAMESGEY